MRTIFRFFFNVVVYVAIVGAIVWGAPKFLSWKFGTQYPIAAITSGSMWPELKTGDMVLIEAIPKEDLKVGDVIVWQVKNSPNFTIHRVLKLNEKTLVTKGDANFEPDDPISYDQVVGRTVTFRGRQMRIPYIGYLTIKASKYIQ
jgi:signal peptidase I